jgi:phage terminase large subunit GpA-like protein
MSHLEKQIALLLDTTKQHLSNISPSEWYEQNMVMPRGSAFPGKFEFDLTPYWREPLDCANPLHPAKEVSIMKGAQLGGTVAVLNPIVGYTIAKHPGNMMFLTGHSELSEASMLKIDTMIDNCNIRHLIVPNVLRKKNSRSGDTNKSKEFAGGDLKSGSVTNHNLLRQHDVMIMIVDDYDAAPAFSKHAGATRELVQKRTSAFAHKKKIYWVSSPQITGMSNIEEVFLLGDQRYYYVPCPKCGDHIKLDWSVDIKGTDGKEKGGIFWKSDKVGRVIRNSVGYICQYCSGFFDDSKKYEMNLAGFWQPTVDAKEEDHYSYQISSLYAPPGMDSWAYYAQQFVNANPPKGKRHEKKHQTFKNVVLGETYKQQGTAPEANQLQANIRNYKILELPDKMSIDDGNGHIVLLTCACDLNGKIDDARLDYEIVAWTESGSSYSISHGSIGTFIRRENAKKKKVDREHWTYESNRTLSVWPEFDKVLNTVFETGNGRQMKIFISGVDTGFFTKQAYDYIDKSNFNIVGLKGNNEDKFIRYGVDLPLFKTGRERSNLYLVEVNMIKDDLARLIDLKWDSGNDDSQPVGFMNFPTPSDGLYLFNNYFSHYEGEHKIVEQKDDKSIASRWVKKTSNSENHLWDCRVYNIVLKEILTWMVCKELKIKEYTWQDYVDAVLQSVK